MGKRLMAQGAPLMFYVHPREIDPQHPRIAMPYTRHFKSYVNLHTTEPKIRRIIRDFPVTTCRDFLFGSTLELPHKKPALSAVLSTELVSKYAGARDRLSLGTASRIAK
jgi:hypothetical protein